MNQDQSELLLLHILATTSPISYRPKNFISGLDLLNKIATDYIALGGPAGWNWPGLGGTAPASPAVQYANALVHMKTSVSDIQNSGFTPTATSIGWGGGGAEHPSLAEVTGLLGM
jgi:hypothetical protein